MKNNVYLCYVGIIICIFINAGADNIGSKDAELINEKHEFSGFKINIFYNKGCRLEKIIVSHDFNEEIIDSIELKEMNAIRYHGIMFEGARDSIPIMDILTYAPGTGVTDYRLHRFELGSKVKYIGSYKLYELYAIPENSKEPAQLNLVSLMKLQIDRNDAYGLYFKPVNDERLKDKGNVPFLNSGRDQGQTPAKD